MHKHRYTTPAPDLQVLHISRTGCSLLIHRYYSACSTLASLFPFAFQRSTGRAPSLPVSLSCAGRKGRAGRVRPHATHELPVLPARTLQLWHARHTRSCGGERRRGGTQRKGRSRRGGGKGATDTDHGHFLALRNCRVIKNSLRGRNGPRMPVCMRLLGSVLSSVTLAPLEPMEMRNLAVSTPLSVREVCIFEWLGGPRAARTCYVP